MIPTASAACPDVEVVFARGRQESPGAGVLGNAFVSALRSKVNKNVGLYAVRYPADTEVAVGANDMSAHVAVGDQRLPGHPGGAGRLLARRGGHRRRDGGSRRDVRLHQPAAAGRRSAHRRGRTLRQRHPVGRADRELQPGLRRPDHRPVPRRRPHLQSGRSAHLVRTTGTSTWPSGYIQDGMVNQAADFVAGKLA